MGTHPIFESDFDCLTVMLDWLTDGAKVRLDKNGQVVSERVALFATPLRAIEFVSALSDPHCVAKAQKAALSIGRGGVEAIGLDCEWDWDSHEDGNLPLLQIATGHTVFVFHQLPRLPPKMKEIMESPAILKVGVAVGGDLDRIARKFKIAPSGGCDLRSMAGAASGQSNWSLADMSQHFLRKKISKNDAIRRSRWSSALSSEQIVYAATDADISLQLFRHFSDQNS